MSVLISTLSKKANKPISHRLFLFRLFTVFATLITSGSRNQRWISQKKKQRHTHTSGIKPNLISASCVLFSRASPSKHTIPHRTGTLSLCDFYSKKPVLSFSKTPFSEWSSPVNSRITLKRSRFTRLPLPRKRGRTQSVFFAMLFYSSFFFPQIYVNVPFEICV